ncbi:MAG: colicin immunity domain-containing protein [Chlamydiales bacterium]|nr:colicin immunity domain-containing protein [Chlamydiales bacterium]
MFNKVNKKYIYSIIDMYLSEKIDASTFCDEFYYSYDLELDHNCLNEIEKKVFSDLGEIVDRFSPFEKDLKEYPQFFVSEKDLKKSVSFSKGQLGDSFFLIV